MLTTWAVETLGIEAAREAAVGEACTLARTIASLEAGAEIDLVLELPRGEIWTVEIRSAHAPTLRKGFHIARRDIQPKRSFAVYSGTERYPIADGIEAIGLGDLFRDVAAWT